MNQYDKIYTSINKIQSDLYKDIISVGILVGIIVGLIGLVILINEIYIINKIRQINSWPIIHNGGTIIDSQIETTSSNTTYSILLMSRSYTNSLYRIRTSFTYKINDKTLISNRSSYYEPWQSNPIISRVQYDHLKKGSIVDIRINPHNVTEAYIYNKMYDQYYRLVIAIIMIAISAYVVVKG